MDNADQEIPSGEMQNTKGLSPAEAMVLILKECLQATDNYASTLLEKYEQYDLGAGRIFEIISDDMSENVFLSNMHNAEAFRFGGHVAIRLCEEMMSGQQLNTLQEYMADLYYNAREQAYEYIKPETREYVYADRIEADRAYAIYLLMKISEVQDQVAQYTQSMRLIFNELPNKDEAKKSSFYNGFAVVWCAKTKVVG